MPKKKKGGPNHRRFRLTIYRLSGEPITVPGCSRQTLVIHIIDAIFEASRHRVPDIDDFNEWDVHLIVGIEVVRCPRPHTLRQANIDQYTLLNVVLTEGTPPPLVDTSD